MFFDWETFFRCWYQRGKHIDCFQMTTFEMIKERLRNDKFDPNRRKPCSILMALFSQESRTTSYLSSGL
ncbi:Uncharacterized protein TCM_029827 [Theobroma cacao]|uniref:Uncharacterized protein n=1 Tax=Theobroma cacao TaxID=3641 RepID=A0A061GEC0_THECC|nr:Uncharacterized protein TCM_029827 [Theobroma cacao]